MRGWTPRISLHDFGTIACRNSGFCGNKLCAWRMSIRSLPTRGDTTTQPW